MNRRQVTPVLSDSGPETPPWATKMLKSLEQQLHHINGQLEGQNMRWQSIEGKLEQQNIRMNQIESQMSQMNEFKQNLQHNNTKVESLYSEIRNCNRKLEEYENTVQNYSDICDGITSSNSETESTINYMMDKLTMLEENQSEIRDKQVKTDEKLIDIQWRSMQENLIFSGIPESDIRRGEIEDCRV